MSTSSDQLRRSGSGAKGPTAPLRDPDVARPWYRRWPLWVAVIVAIGAISVILDLPQHATLQDQASADAAIVNEIDTGIHACEFAVSQAFSIYHGYTTGTFPASDRSLVPQYLREDQQACSFATQSIFGLATITLPNSAPGRDLGSIIRSVLEWSTSDAVGAIDDINTLLHDPRTASALHDLSLRERTLASDRTAAERLWRAAERSLGGARLPSLHLPTLPVPPPAS